MTASRSNTRPHLPAGVTTLPAEHYVDPGWFLREMHAIYFDMWLAAGRLERLSQPGRYFRTQFGNADIIVVRQDAGGVAAFHNVCRHRGTRLCSDVEGTLAGSDAPDSALALRARSVIQCPYHGWTYSTDGRLIGAPHMDKVDGFRRDDFPLLSVATAQWDGHVFINLSSTPVPFREHLAGLDEKFRPWHMEELRCVERRVYEVKANWKLILQNYSECLHCPLAHPLLNRQTHYMSGDNEPPGPTVLGGRMELRESVQTHSLDGRTTCRALGSISPEDQRRVYYYAVLPNFLLNLHPDYMLTFVLWPLAPDRTRIVCEWHYHPDEIRRPDFDPAGAVEFWHRTNQEDWELSETAQAGIASAGYRPGPYSNREELLVALDRWVLGKVGS